MKDKKEDKKKRRNKRDDGENKGEEDQNTINFHPKIDKCDEFLNEGLKMIVDSTNKVSNLEDDLMPFLQKEK